MRVTRIVAVDDSAVVYLARQQHPDRDVRVTVVREPLVDAERWALFRREARMTSASHHPRLAAVYSAGRTEAGQAFVVGESTPGGSLEEMIRERSGLPPVEVARIGRMLTEAVRVAHSAGAFHGDITPRDVLLDDGMGVKLAGFGLATARGETDHTAKADIRGVGSTLLAALIGYGVVRGPRAAEETKVVDSLVELLTRCLSDDEAIQPSLDELRTQLGALGSRRFADVAARSPYRTIRTRTEATSVRRIGASSAVIGGRSRRSSVRRSVLAAVAVALLVGGGGYLLAAALDGSGDAAEQVDASRDLDVPRDAAVERPGGTSPTPSSTTSAASTSIVSPLPTAPTEPVVPATTVPATSEPPVAADPPTPTADVSDALRPSSDGGDAADFVVAYYEIVNAEDLERGWSLLAPEFQARTGFDGYTSFWDRYDVDVSSARLVGETDGGAVVEVAMTYVDGDRRVNEVDQLTLQRTPEGTYLVAAQRVVG
jgi:hypothetical protein